MRPLLALVETTINDTPILALFGDMSDRSSRTDFCRLVCNSVQFGRMAIHNSVAGAARARAYSVQAGTVLMVSLLVSSELNTAAYHRQVQGAVKVAWEVRKHEEELFRQ